MNTGFELSSSRLTAELGSFSAGNEPLSSARVTLINPGLTVKGPEDLQSLKHRQGPGAVARDGAAIAHGLDG